MTGRGLAPRRWRGLVRRRAGLIGLILALGLGAATLFVLARPSLYTATALVLVALPDGRAPDADARMDSEVEILRSDATLLATVRALRLGDDPSFGREASMWDEAIGPVSPAEAAPEDAGVEEERDALGRLRERVTVARRGATFVVSVEVRATQAERAAELANAVAAAYLGLRTAAAAPGLGAPGGELVSRALPPTRPDGPAGAIVMALAGLGSLALAFGTALLSEAFAGGVSSEEQARAAFDLPVLSSVPRLGRRTSGQQVADEYVEHPQGRFAEAIRRTRLGLDALAAATRREEGEGAVLLITSAVPEEGKTAMAATLGRAYALARRRTLLIECDMRRPGLQSALPDAGEGADTGLADLLIAGSAGPERRGIVRVDTRTGLHVVTAGRVGAPAHDSPLASQRFCDIIDVARRRYDMVLLDSPPILPVVDTQHVVRLVDVVALVVKWSGTAEGDVRAALSALAFCPEVPTGVILNRVDPADPALGRYDAYYASDA